MYRPARERIIALELMKLERRQANERQRRTHPDWPQPIAGGAGWLERAGGHPRTGLGTDDRPGGLGT